METNTNDLPQVTTNIVQSDMPKSWSEKEKVERMLSERLVKLNESINFHRNNEGMLEFIQKTFELNLSLLKIIRGN